MTREEILREAKPILFNTEMVKAILDDRKTVTRRNAFQLESGYQYKGIYWAELPVKKRICASFHHEDGTDIHVPVPYFSGEYLYVRETWTKEGKEYYYRADFDSDFLSSCETLSGGYPHECTYHPGCEGCTRESTRIRWKPSIHMPKEAARLFLRVKDVRAEKLWKIDKAGAEAEGCYSGPLLDGGEYHVNPISEFIRVWNSTVMPAERDRYGWEANPFVWVIEFERVVPK